MMRLAMSALGLAVLVALTGCAPEAKSTETETKSVAKPVPEAEPVAETNDVTVAMEEPPSPEKAEKPSEPVEKQTKPEIKEEAKPSAPSPSKQEKRAESTDREKSTSKRTTNQADDKSNQTVADKSQSAMLEIEKEVVALVNKERRQRGLRKLEISESVSRVARKKSEDMKENNYFSHDSPTYGSPFDMLKRFGVKYRMAGENIAAGQTTAEKVMESWMNSDGHRANILNPDYTHIGVGYVKGGSYGCYWTQQFIAK
jgi:uncharacterized YkwD family protein